MRPELTKETKTEEFYDYYWLKEELQLFCRKHGLSASGSKREIAERIETFLRTGEIIKPVKRSKTPKNVELDLHLDTVIQENHRCSQHVRAFLKTVIPNFHFSTYIQQYFKHNSGKTYRDAVNAWHEEEERKKDPQFTKTIGPQFEYNRFIRDFFADPVNKGKSRDEAIQEWNEIKKLPGSNTYGSKPQSI
ncbi:DUF6434 domain-containing protein [Jeotgalibacillus proteolyticus]|uniref:DUF6434 domain-containing protein n=1 Tax=Jeotgalibacillus proteolyticus TaxID=2082395 RepID=UPI003CED4547